jgi:Cysteine-rich CPCC
MFLIKQEPLEIEDPRFVFFDDEKNTFESLVGLNDRISNIEIINRYVLTVEEGMELLLDFAINGEYIYFIYDYGRENTVNDNFRIIFGDPENDESGWEKLNNEGLWVRVYHNDCESFEFYSSEELCLVFSNPNKLSNDEILKYLNEIDTKKGIPSINYLNHINKMNFFAHTTRWKQFDSLDDNDLLVLILYTLKKLSKRYTCPCCGFKTLKELNNYETCPVCKWMDDDIQSFKPHLGGGANEESLIEAQKNFIEIGRASKTFFHSPGDPTSNYEKDENWKPLTEK